MNPKLGFTLGIIILVVLAIYYNGGESKVIEKDFDSNSYYQGYNSSESPDYKRIYSEYNTGAVSAESCKKDSVPVSSGRKVYKPTSELGFLWFWAIPNSEKDTVDSLVDSGEDLGQGRTLYEVPKGTELVAIADGSLVPNTQYPQKMYPSTDYTKGVHLGYDIKLIEHKVAFRITYMSMEKWWVCGDKKEPDEFIDGDENKPKYIMGETVGNKELYSATVVGYSGYTGVPSSKLINDKSFLIVKVQRADVDENGQITSAWSDSSVSELYAGG